MQPYYRALTIGGLLIAFALQAGAQQIPSTPGASARILPRSTTPRILPGTNNNVFSTIQGNALNSTNASLANAVVRLRDARVGQIIDTQISDKSGLFAFRTVDPGSYIVEIVGPDSSVLAASQVLSVNAGDAVSAVVKLPFRTPPFAGVLGSATPSAPAVTTQAAASGVLATTVTQPISPVQ